jgi:putative hydrolase of the HAD superfamily
MYSAALDAIGIEARDALFVGDRLREDYEGPRALGMRAVVFTAHADHPPPEGIPTIASLSEVPGLL